MSAAAMASSMVSVPAPLPDAEVMSGATLEPVTDGEMAVGAVTGVASGFQAAPTVPVVDGGGAATMSPVPTTAPGEVTAPTVSDPAPPPLTPTPEPLLVSDVVGAQQPGSVEPADTIAPTRTTDPGPAATADVGTDGAAGTGAPTVPVDPASVQQVPGAGLAADQVVRPGVAPGAVASEDSGSPAPTTAATVEAVAASTTSSSRPASTTTATQSVSTLPPPGAAPLPGTFADLARDIDGAAVVSNPLELRPSGGTHRGAAGLPVSVPSLSMDLSDEGLGPLTLQALNGAGVVHLKLTAGDRAVGDMLSRAGAELRRDLEATGTTVGTLDIGHAGSQSLGSGGPFARDPGSSDDGRTAAVPSLRGTVAHVPASQHPTVTNRAATVTDGLDLRI
ncbi:MAG: flagellar hook-length control protein FliK [Ilumatobacteraceae bacterium]